jgi:TctA family transporter
MCAMGDLLSNLGLGFGTVMRVVDVALPLVGTVPLPLNILLCFLGCLVGTLIGVLPGVGPIATIAMLLPITFGLDPVGALIMLAGIYYGAQYGGSTTAILVNIPGEATSVVTTLDGHQMARQGRAGVALGIAALGSFFAGCVATVLIAALGAPLTKLALVFGPAEYFSLMVMGLVFAVVLARGSILKAIAMILVGVLLSTAGTDLETGEERMTFGLQFLSDGVDFAVLAMGLFGIAEVLRNLDQTESRDVVRAAIGRLLPSMADLRQSAAPVVRGTVIGSVLGILPGNGAVLGPFASYTVEKRIARDPSRFGRGAIEGVAGPESANNAGAQTSFIPLLTLGIPPNAVMALMVGAMTIPGSAGDDAQPGAVLGHDRFDVGRQLDAPGHQPAAGGALGEAAASAVPADVPGHRHVLLHRHLQHQLPAAGRADDRVLRPGGLCAHQAGLRAGAAAARLRAGAADGGEPAPRPRHLARGPDDVLGAAHQCGAAGHRCRAAGAGAAAGSAEGAGRGVHRVGLHAGPRGATCPSNKHL